MKTYRYKAIGYDGNISKGEYQCSDSKELIAYLYSKKQHLLEVQTSLNIKGLRLQQKIKLKNLSFFCKQIGTMLEIGIPILEAIKMCCFQLKSGQIYDNCAYILGALRRGASLYEAMKNAPNGFPEFMLHMVNIGEESGNLTEIFNNLSIYYYKENKLKGKVAAAAAYPVCVLTFTIMVAMVLLITIVPSMVSMITSMGGEIPLITSIVMALSHFLKVNLPYVLLVTGLLAVLLIYLIKNKRIKISSIVKKIPVYNKVYFKRSNYEFLYGVYLLHSGGSTIVKALEGAAAVLKDDNLRLQISKSVSQIREGESILEALLSVEVIDYTSLSVIKLGEETGKLCEMLGRLLEILEDELNSQIEKALELIHPLAIILVGFIVGIIVISIALPMFSMYNI
ncbi:type II secretion system F family protein [Clostridium thermarum]|uniref:type II secretion system F family protein n=1 Tax=Clostridium thermarum TaxID=1716543 RepID=UPI0013D3EE13|nr:type II secretion system F family protein [Clostridium thermarum]